VKKLSRKYYFIDTENVGDRWFDMPKKIRRKDRIITFYTQHHSKHLEEFLAKQVHNPKILWLECAAGSNALDYQLMGVLSYFIAKHPNASFCIYSNDKDYQYAIDFWKSRGIKISQKGFEITNKKKAKKKKQKGQNKEVKNFPPEKDIPAAVTREEIIGQGKLTEEQYVTEIAKSVPVSNLGGWYQALVAILGQEKGRSWYLKIKEDSELQDTLSNYCTGDEHFRGVNLVATVLNLHDLDVTRAEEAYKIIRSHNRKNLKTIRADFDKKFGKKPQQRYFKVLRPLIRVIKGK
jgi:hypothetical protein